MENHIPLAWKRLCSITTLVLAEPILAPKDVQGSIQVHVYHVTVVPNGLQDGSPVGELSLLLLLAST
jgi:hypothetical protein